MQEVIEKTQQVPPSEASSCSVFASIFLLSTAVAMARLEVADVLKVEWGRSLGAMMLGFRSHRWWQLRLSRAGSTRC